MDYNRKELVDWVRGIYQNLDDADKQDALRFFPELRESEDEKIRKTLVEYFGPKAQLDFVRGVQIQKIRDWLEKQKEPLPIPDKFSGLKSLMLQYLQSAANRKDDTKIESDTDLFGRKILDYVWKYDEKQKEQKPAWSEEDEKVIRTASAQLTHYGNLLYDDGERTSSRNVLTVADKLKSLRPQPNTVSVENATKFGNLEYERGVKDGIQHSENHHWKPSEEQMTILWDAISNLKHDGYKHTEELISLYEQLKKL